MLNQTQEEKERIRRDKELNDIRIVISTPEGRRFYWRLLAEAKVFHACYTGDVNSTMFNEGQRNIGLTFFNELMTASPTAYSQMQREINSREKMDESDINEIINNKDVLTR